jgi:hypothetical protein
VTQRKQVVVLEVEYDDAQYDPPAEWDWATLTDSPDPIAVIAAGAEREVTA